MRIVHLYPFGPRGRHGGTLRLQAAVEATARFADEVEVHTFDASGPRWDGPLDPDDLARVIQDPSPVAPPPAGSLKRRAFPSTLWESGRKARAALPAHRGQLKLRGEDVLFLHTTYLAPLLGSIAVRPATTVCDVYDLVWRAHSNDATAAQSVLRPVRRAYARSVRRREEAALARADVLAVAACDDLQALGRGAWVPTPTPVDAVPPPPPGERLRVGLLGNFAHVSTRASANLVLACGLAADPTAELVFAGLHSERFLDASERVVVLGPVERTEDFYARVDCVMAPVVGGSGIKVKLAEAVLAGRPVVTTELGAAAYPAKLRSHFAIAGADGLDAATVRAAIHAFDAPTARAAFEAALGAEAVNRAYAAALDVPAAATP